MKLSRVGESLGLNTLPSVYFRYSKEIRRGGGFPYTWEVFNPVDQLKIMAKFVLMYKLRKMNPATTFFLDKHVVIVEINEREQIDVADNSMEIQMHVNFVFNYANGSDFESHELQLVITEGHENPFPDCIFN